MNEGQAAATEVGVLVCMKDMLCNVYVDISDNNALGAIKDGTIFPGKVLTNIPLHLQSLSS